MASKEQIAALRAALSDHKIDAFLIPRAGPWPGEFVPENAERLAWISGFTGSAGIGIIAAKSAIVLTDGRYSIQVKEQVDEEIWQAGDIRNITASQWLCDTLSAGARVGFDPSLHSLKTTDKLRRLLEAHQIELVSLDFNPVDRLWTDRPPTPQEPVTLFDEKIAGRSAAEKCHEIAAILQKNKVTACFLSAPDSVAWLLNIRGRDVPHVPVPLCTALITEDASVTLFIDPARISKEVRAALGSEVEIFSVDEMSARFSEIKGAVQVDPMQLSVKVAEDLKQAGLSLQHEADPCIDLKAIKTESEQAAIKRAHVIDAQPLEQLRQWLKSGKGEGVSEVAIAEKIDEFRRMNSNDFAGTSFDTIAGWRGNGAVIHYRAEPENALTIEGPGLLLIDSGGQYESGGTTDLTRTYALGGTPAKEQKRYYTLVLKSHIAAARAVFPAGTTGVQIDAMARAPLWEHGLDFPHGLGHGVGCFLNVHEDGARLSPAANVVLKPGMLISNEPGLYFEGEYGIRLENLVLVQRTGKKDNLGRALLCFETVSAAYFDEDLIDFAFLSTEEKAWLGEYHTRVSAVLSKTT